LKIHARLTPTDIIRYLSQVDCHRGDAAAIRSALFTNRSDPKLGAYLDAHGLQIALHASGINAKILEGARERFREDALDVLVTRPFEMIERVKGVDFGKALALWRRLSPDQNCRLALARSAITDRIQRKRRSGHASSSRVGLFKEIRSDLIISPATLDAAAAQLETAGVIVSASVHGQVHYAHREAFEAETVIATQIAQRRGQGWLVDQFAIMHAMIQAGLAKPDASQMEAVELAVANRISMVTGGPGTGKSSILRAIATLAIEQMPTCRIKLVALAARVARAIGAKTGIEADTIHSSLGCHPGQGMTYGPHNPIPVDLLFIEEAFMIGNGLFADLLKALPQQCKIVIIGDPEQLPPVMEGKPAEAIMSSAIIPVARLTINHRSEARDIPTAGKRVMAGNKPASTDNLSIVAVSSVEAALNETKLAFERASASGASVQILTAIHDGPLGTTSINRLITGREKIALGDTVMQTVNDRERAFFNGELATVVHLEPDGLLAQKDDGSIVRCTPSQMRDLVPAWAISFHKSQGLEYDIVINVVSNLHRHMLGQNLLNVGITRAKRRCIIIDHGNALQVLSKSNQTAKRSTLLTHMLRQKCSQ
jgi:exodeoxyribonuclease V alpha subunit